MNRYVSVSRIDYVVKLMLSSTVSKLPNTIKQQNESLKRSELLDLKKRYQAKNLSAVETCPCCTSILSKGTEILS